METDQQHREWTKAGRAVTANDMTGGTAPGRGLEHQRTENDQLMTDHLISRPNVKIRNRMKQECIFCGEEHDNRPSGHIGRWVMLDEGAPICSTCRESLGDRHPREWFRWLRTNDPYHWEQLVDHHRLGSGPVADMIRRIRIEQP